MSLIFFDRRLTIVSIFSLALLVRLAFILMQQDGFYFYDSVLYSKAANNFLSVGDFGPHYDRAPGYPLFLAGV